MGIVTDNAFVLHIIQNEGNKDYQRKMGYYKNGNFQLYKDTLGYWTIGFGHLCSPSEIRKYANGISELNAQLLLTTDLACAERDARKMFQFNKHPLAVQQLLVEMVFQLGAPKAKQFLQFAAALDGLDYKAAARELIASNWYRQTPKRVQGHVDVLRGI
ncbi:glycoside hydrolase family protein [Aeromonas salmonicida]|uniref:glycoside hydrolase family protein n=1 Tax=Aeromonas salmonicida TaxID=645 RepID=UPI003CFCDA37